MAYATVTLTGTYHEFDGTPAKGHVRIFPSVKVVKDTTGNVILTNRHLEIQLDAQGAFSVDLPATDDPTLNPNNFGYTIAARLDHHHPKPVSFSLPAALGATTVEDLTPVDPSTFEATATYAESSEVAALDSRVTTVETDVAGKADTADLATVATTGNYTDLTSLPTIPTTAAEVGALPDTTVIPSTPGDVGAEPAGLSQATSDTLAATYAKPTAMTMALLGDSITNQNSYNANEGATYANQPWVYYSGAGFWTRANALLGQRFQLVKATGPSWEFGGSGKTAAQLNSEGHVDAVIASGASWCHYMAGRNDIWIDAATPTQTFAHIQTAVDTLTNAGIQVVLSTIVPGVTGTTEQHAAVRATNRLITEYARNRRGVILNDWFMALVDPTTGLAKSSYLGDGTHPNAAGAARMGYALAKVLEPATPKSELQIDAHGLLGTSGLQLGTGGGFGGANPAGGSGQLATGSICYVNSGVTVIGSKVPRTDLIPGEWQQLQQTSASTNAYAYTMRNSNAGVDWATGEQVYGVLEYETDATSWASNQLFLTLRALPADLRVDGGYASDNVLFQPSVARGVLVTPPLTIPAGTSYLRLDANCGGGTHTARFGRMQIYKV